MDNWRTDGIDPDRPLHEESQSGFACELRDSAPGTSTLNESHEALAMPEVPDQSPNCNGPWERRNDFPSETGNGISLEMIYQKLIENQQRLDRLQEDFKTKLSDDTLKQKTIDRLHEELQDYKNDILKTQFESSVLDAIKIIDDLRKLTRHYRDMDSASTNPEKLLDFLEGIPEEIEEILYWQGIRPFSCSGDTFDPTRQRILKKVGTSEPDKDKLIAEHIRPGYEWNGKVLRPEMIAVFCFEKSGSSV